ncbi:MAG: putative rane protein [Herbinix sp.]|jgi:hypothetical protein|nr:putative rane protein [Herbinix sp.]
MELNLTEFNIASLTAVTTVTTSEVMPGGDGAYTDGGINTEVGVASGNDPLLSSWPFVIGISAAVLLVSVALGILLAKRKIKKGIELYED